MIMNKNKIHVAIMALAAVTLLPCLAQAQDTSRNYVKTVTMLDAGGTDSLQAVQYYNGLGRPTVSVATANADGGTACTLTTYDALGRELRKYAPVPGSGLDYMTESAVSSAGYDFYNDNGGFSENHYDVLDRVTAVGIAGDAWIQAGGQDRTAYFANTLSDEVLHYEAPEDAGTATSAPSSGRQAATTPIRATT